MSCKSCNLPPCAAPKHQFIDNFLRRLAFNLGNTPSETEVKIISCIPIDVTHLLERIRWLEKQLEEATCPARRIPPCHEVRTAILSHIYPEGDNNHFGDNKCFSANQEQSVSSTGSSSRAKIYKTMIPEAVLTSTRFDQTTDSDFLKNHVVQRNKESHKYNNLRKIKPEPRKQKENLIYYTKTFGSPYLFKKNKPQKQVKEKKSFEKDYLVDVIRKQYHSESLHELSKTSRITVPVCKDVRQNDTKYSYDYDTSHKNLHSLDEILPKKRHDNLPKYPSVPVKSFAEPAQNRNRYYEDDIGMYDIFPVKEKANNTSEIPRNHEVKNGIGTLNNQTNFSPQPVIVNYHITREKEDKQKKVIEREILLNKMYRKRDKGLYSILDHGEPNDCLVECGTVYKKHCPGLKLEKMPGTKPFKMKKFLRSQRPQIYKKSIVTTPVKTVAPVTGTNDKKTEETLNQIKFILQTVLTEVKNNSELQKKQSCYPKKDAGVQKGISRNEMQTRSSFMHSFDYGAYNMNPYLPSYSQLMPSNHLFYNMPHQTLAHMQQYPFIVQGAQKHVCATCYQENAHISNSIHRKNITTASTNTEKKESNSVCGPETEKLIKEIYKSLALNIDIPKDISNSNCKNIEEKVSKKESRRSIVSNSKRKSLKEGDFGTNMKTISEKGSQKTHDQSNNISRSDDTTSDREYERNETERQQRLKYIEQSESQEYTEQTEEHGDETNNESDDNVSETEYEEEGEVEESDDKTVFVEKKQEVKKQEKKGVLSKIKSIFINEKKINKQKIKKAESEESEANDFDEYQTVYRDRHSKPVEVPMRAEVRKSIKPIVYSKVKHVTSSSHRDRKHEKPKITPYLEQEYRRQCVDKVYHDNPRRYATEKSQSRAHYDATGRPVYTQNYEIMNARVVYDHMNPGSYRRIAPMDRREKTIKSKNKDAKIDNTGNWKSLHNEMKMKQMRLQKRYPQQEMDPLSYDFVTNKKLAKGDIKIRNAMLKRFFYKRNHFSPRNLEIKSQDASR